MNEWMKIQSARLNVILPELSVSSVFETGAKYISIDNRLVALEQAA